MTEMPGGAASVRNLRWLATLFDVGALSPLTVVLDSDSDLKSSEGLALIDDVSRFLRPTAPASGSPLGDAAAGDRPDPGSRETLGAARRGERAGPHAHGVRFSRSSQAGLNGRGGQTARASLGRVAATRGCCRGTRVGPVGRRRAPSERPRAAMLPSDPRRRRRRAIATGAAHGPPRGLLDPRGSRRSPGPGPAPDHAGNRPRHPELRRSFAAYITPDGLPLPDRPDPGRPDLLGRGHGSGGGPPTPHQRVPRRRRGPARDGPARRRERRVGRHTGPGPRGPAPELVRGPDRCLPRPHPDPSRSPGLPQSRLHDGPDLRLRLGATHFLFVTIWGARGSTGRCPISRSSSWWRWASITTYS